MSLGLEISRPIFVYDPAFSRVPVGYRLKIDEREVTSFFSLAGIPDSQTSATTVSFIKELPKDADRDDYAAYNYKERNLKVYLDPFWHEYRKCKILADEVIGGNRAVESDDFDYLLAGNTERTLKYLMVAPPKRGRIFINKLLLIALQRELNSAILHEIQHIKDHEWVLRLGFLDEFFNLLGVGKLWYELDPLEKRAEKFEDRMIGKAMQRPMVIITPTRL